MIFQEDITLQIYIIIQTRKLDRKVNDAFDSKGKSKLAEIS